MQDLEIIIHKLKYKFCNFKDGFIMVQLVYSDNAGKK